MKKTDLIAEIINLYDERDMLQNRLNCQTVTMPDGDDEPEVVIPKIKELLTYARRQLVKEYTGGYYGDRVEYEVDEDGVEHYTSYEKWFQRNVRNHDLPEWLSKTDFANICDIELHDKYLEQKIDAKESWLEDHPEAKVEED